VLERIVVLRPRTTLDLPDLFANGNQRVAQAVALCFAFALGWFNHQGASQRPTHGWCVESVVHEPLCDIVGLDANADVKRTQVNDELVRASASVVGVNHFVVIL
jgi:hypothetical protein